MSRSFLSGRRSASRLFAFLLFGSLIGCSPQLSAQRRGRFTSNGRSVDVTAFNADMEKMIRQIGIPAVSLAIIDHDSVVFSHTYGYKEMQPRSKADKNTVFEAASLSKIFLVFAVYQLVQEGQFDLSRPMYKYLPYPRLAHDNRYKLITPRMVLSHTSGIENWQWENDPDTLEIISDPGTKFVYSGEGFQYLAKVITQVLHQPYETYIDRMVLDPLAIGDTYLKYSHTGTGAAGGETPSDYAIGYDDFGVKFKKTRDTIPVPASGAQTTAAQYAKLIIGMFDGKYLSKTTVDDMLRPVIRIREDNDAVWMGSGFSVIFTKNDTIVSFSGSNPGFKSELFYSVRHKKGFVFFTNSDRGSMIIQHLCRLTAGLDIDFLFVPSYYEQYPSAAIRLFSLYREKGAAAMLAAVDKLKEQGKLNVKTLDELGDTFMGHDKGLAMRLLRENISLFPRSPIAYGLLGSAQLQDKNYQLAYKNLSMARDLHFDLWDITPMLRQCEEKTALAH